MTYIAPEARRTRPGAPGDHRRSSLRGKLILLWCALLLTPAGCAPVSFLITPVSADRKLVEHVVSRDSVWHNDKIALIDVQGVLRNEPERSLLGQPGDNPVALFKEKLDRAAADDRVKAVVLRINSPGGGVTASDLMYTELLRFKQQSGKPLIASLLDVGASGGYYIACAADLIFAHPTSVTGSIGVIMVAPDFSGTMHKLGIRANIIKSAELKDAGSPFREMSAADREIFQGMIDDMYARFLNVVATARGGIEKTRLRELADGRVYLAPQAEREGLIDELGTLHDALAAAKQAGGLEGRPVVVVEYARPHSHRANIYANTADPPAQVSLINIELPPWLGGTAPQFMYLWAPGYSD